ncbi:tetratricopeptide repeat protein [Actinoallomurus sp. NPDC050550]|uniref:tetratricopeptide repeat protein n=1 Tax=Actinoallomurus sp. NPDC050550 TaxID=3154937 RepID=UPI0033DF9B33
MKYSEQDPQLAAMWLPYEEGSELCLANRLEEAIPLFQQALRAGEELLGPDSRHFFPILVMLGTAYANLDRPAEALPFFLRVQAITAEQFGGKHPTHGEAQAKTAGIYRRLGRPADALLLDEQNMTICYLTYGRSHPEFVKAIVALVDDYYDLNDQAEYPRFLDLAEELIASVPGVDDRSIRVVQWHRTQQAKRT